VSNKVGLAAALAVFDEAIAKITTQGAPSMRAKDGLCLYRGENGLKCAAGHFIPDSKYEPEMEGQSIGQVNSGYNLGFSKNKMEALSRAQLVHDATSVFQKFESRSFLEEFDKMATAKRIQLIASYASE
jgi:hypothetical protein